MRRPTSGVMCQHTVVRGQSEARRAAAAVRSMVVCAQRWCCFRRSGTVDEGLGGPPAATRRGRRSGGGNAGAGTGASPLRRDTIAAKRPRKHNTTPRTARPSAPHHLKSATSSACCSDVKSHRDGTRDDRQRGAHTPREHRNLLRTGTGNSRVTAPSSRRGEALLLRIEDPLPRGSRRARSRTERWIADEQRQPCAILVGGGLLLGGGGVFFSGVVSSRNTWQTARSQSGIRRVRS